MENRKEALLGKTMEELREVASLLGMPSFSAKQMAQWIYRHRVRDIQEMSNLSIRHRTALQEHFVIGMMEHTECQRSADGTVKYLFPTQSGKLVESVFIPETDRGTLCVSCQVGCRMGCHFCMTGRQGFHGNLTATDILNQLYALPERDQLTNVVFMGQGEPMDNLDAVLRVTQLLTAEYGYAWSPKRITVSTVGIQKGMLRFLDESECHLAVSLHSPFPEERAKIMPAENAYSLREFIPMLSKRDWSHQRRLSFEYIVFEGLNDTDAHLRELVRLLSPIECRVNLIRFHQIPDTPFCGASEERMIQMREYLTRHGVTTTIRASRGQDIYAACGLLNTSCENRTKEI